ncbi:hypothetical protein B0H19DRAFT_918799, partial [Mycena capillaripes]
DGSVILQAQDTQFRVHWSVLSQHSSFFRDLEDLPQPPNQSTLDGCPVLELQDVAVEVEHLLKALFNPSVNQTSSFPFPYIASFVRLGRKYDFKVLFDIAVERLAFENPRPLQEYDALLDNLSAAAGKRVGHSTTRIVPYKGIYHDILTLAKEHDLLAILPCAYFRIAKDSLENIYKEYPRLDGSPCVLSPVERAACALGHEKLFKAQWKTGNTLGCLLAWEPAFGCKQRTACQYRREGLLRDILLLCEVRTTFRATKVRSLFCPVCAEPTEAAMTVGRAKMWEDLPSFFNLPPWNELKNSNEP